MVCRSTVQCILIFVIISCHLSGRLEGWGEWARTEESYTFISSSGDDSQDGFWDYPIQETRVEGGYDYSRSDYSGEDEWRTAGTPVSFPSPSPSPSPANCSSPEKEHLTTRQIISRIFGGASIACWVFVTAPQLYRNWKNGTAEALAFGFIMCWVCGDLSNLLGCILTGQLLTQTALAVYYMIADAFMVAQVVYYKIKDSRRKYAQFVDGGEESFPPSKGSKAKLNHGTIDGAYNGGESGSVQSGRSVNGASSMGQNLMAGAVVAASLSNVAEAVYRAAVDDPCDTEDDSKEGKTKHIIGVTFAWTSAVLYLSSRIPQVVKNFKRKSTEGLSFGMFVLTVSGNLTYAASIFLESTELEYLYNELPYIVGSLGTLTFDLMVWGQFYVYGGLTPKKDIYDVEDVPPPPQYQPKTVTSLRTNYYDRLNMQQAPVPTVSLPIRNEFGEVITTV